MTISSTTKKVLATVTAAGVLTLGGASAAYAADGSAGSSSSGPAATARANRPHVRAVAIKTAFTAAADTLGMTPQQLRDAVRTGPQSIASVAGDQTGAVTDAIVSALGAKLDEAVANGTITAERADKARERLPELADRFVNRVPGSHGG